jgi:hypothetical protein
MEIINIEAKHHPHIAAIYLVGIASGTLLFKPQHLLGRNGIKVI